MKILTKTIKHRDIIYISLFINVLTIWGGVFPLKNMVM